jgi:hypothetical protein
MLSIRNKTFILSLVMLNVVMLSVVAECWYAECSCAECWYAQCCGATLCRWYKSAARFCCQVASWVLDMFCNFYLVKNHKIANNSATTEAREKYTQICNR